MLFVNKGKLFEELRSL